MKDAEENIDGGIINLILYEKPIKKALTDVELFHIYFKLQP